MNADYILGFEATRFVIKVAVQMEIFKNQVIALIIISSASPLLRYPIPNSPHRKNTCTDCYMKLTIGGITHRLMNNESGV
jgi:hypothetical protein